MSSHMNARIHIGVHGENPPLALEFHPSGSAVYFRLTSETVARTAEVEEGVLADYDEHGTLVGFELLEPEGPDVAHVLARLKQKFAAEAPELRSLEAFPA